MPHTFHSHPNDAMQSNSQTAPLTKQTLNPNYRCKNSEHLSALNVPRAKILLPPQPPVYFRMKLNEFTTLAHNSSLPISLLCQIIPFHTSHSISLKSIITSHIYAHVFQVSPSFSCFLLKFFGGAR